MMRVTYRHRQRVRRIRPSYGIAVVAGERGEREIANFLCRSAVTISEEYEPFRAAVASQTSREVLERLEEVQDGPFDGWF